MGNLAIYRRLEKIQEMYTSTPPPTRFSLELEISNTFDKTAKRTARNSFRIFSGILLESSKIFNNVLCSLSLSLSLSIFFSFLFFNFLYIVKRDPTTTSCHGKDGSLILLFYVHRQQREKPRLLASIFALFDLSSTKRNKRNSSELYDGNVLSRVFTVVFFRLRQ